MSLAAGALILAWITIVLVVFALTGLLRQLRQLQDVAFGSSAFERPLSAVPIEQAALVARLTTEDIQQVVAQLPQTGIPSLVVFVKPGCPSCDYLLSAMPGLAKLSGSHVSVVVVGHPLPDAIEAAHEITSIHQDHSDVAALQSLGMPAVVVLDRSGVVVAANAAESVAYLEVALPAELFDEVRRRVA